MNQPLVSINVIVHNGSRYIKHCLEAVRAQTYENLEVNIFDNASDDGTREIIRAHFPEFNLIEHPTNLGAWPGFDESLKHAHGKYAMMLSVDVMLHSQFIEKAVTVSEQHPRLGALQAKVYAYHYDQLDDGSYQTSRTIDTCGFELRRSRRVGNIGHGQPDSDQFADAREIFAVEGAMPFFRRAALEDVRIEGRIADPDYFWYGDDLDLTWRMRLFGWEQWYEPSVIAYHDRSTTKGHSKGPLDYLRRRAVRAQIPLKKRMLDWSNVRFTIIKNDYIINVLRDLPFIAVRDVQTLGYWLLFEPRMYAAIGRVIRHLPTMLKRRKLVMARATATPNSIHQWFK